MHLLGAWMSHASNLGYSGRMEGHTAKMPCEVKDTESQPGCEIGETSVGVCTAILPRREDERIPSRRAPPPPQLMHSSSTPCDKRTPGQMVKHERVNFASPATSSPPRPSSKSSMLLRGLLSPSTHSRPRALESQLSPACTYAKDSSS